MKSVRHAPITVVVPAYNEEDNIVSCLDSIASQTVLPSEVIVVANACTDRTYDKALSLKNTFGQRGVTLNVINVPQKGVALARNTGFNAAANEIIASTDADSVPRKDWIEHIHAHFNLRPHIVAITGPVVMTDAPRPIPAVTRLGWYIFITKILEVYAGFQTITTANAGIKKTAFLAAGGFDNSITSPSGTEGIDDSEFSSRLSAHGAIITDRKMLVESTFRRYDTPKKAIKTTVTRARAWRGIKKQHLALISS
ncbi:glycosyltransferase family 2 protein [candidate division WWE3 bacterium]|uniref:Glycosyltransferase family 2 protein n=1 Tax=candidate division WWE3 bacterium TaxID=2053526 RepID=A0A955LKS2_UNCKA|nr:glycosyltransferase family 2 protein [candidate division WWE3 bacterium]